MTVIWIKWPCYCHSPVSSININLWVYDSVRRSNADCDWCIKLFVIICIWKRVLGKIRQMKVCYSVNYEKFEKKSNLRMSYVERLWYCKINRYPLRSKGIERTRFVTIVRLCYNLYVIFKLDFLGHPLSCFFHENFCRLTDRLWDKWHKMLCM